MKQLSAVNKYFWKYRYRFIGGIFFVVSSNYFAALAPELTGYLIGKVQEQLPNAKVNPAHKVKYDWLVHAFTEWANHFPYGKLIAISSIAILLFALLRGILMFFMRQTIIVMSRHIEYDQKNEVYEHYQKLDASFYKTHSTGDLMNRMAEDVSRVRMYTGPALMYLINLVAMIIFCLINMFRKDVHLALVVLAPLPILAITIYIVNTIINKKSERVQASLSDLTTQSQESYSGIRVIKSFVQEKAMFGFFKKNAEIYRQNAVGLAKLEAVYFPSMTLIIGLSTLITIFIGGQMALQDTSKVGLIVEFVIYLNMLTFPVSAIGWVASMIQRAAASQKRLNEFLLTVPKIDTEANASDQIPRGDISFNNVSFTYAHTGIQAIKDFSLTVKEGEKILILGKTGSGKTTLAQLLLRSFDPDKGNITIAEEDIKLLPVRNLREQISYVPQDVFLFSDTIKGNISFGLKEIAADEDVKRAARYASIDNEIQTLEKGYDTLVGERGVTLSGGQKQRVSIARAIIKDASIMLFDDCLSAVDTKTENTIINNLYNYLGNRTAIIITHRIFTVFNFDKIVILDNGRITEQGTHQELLAKNGYYAELYNLQISSNN